MAKKLSGLKAFSSKLIGWVDSFGRTRLITLILFASLFLVRLPTIQRAGTEDSLTYSLRMTDRPIALGCLSFLMDDEQLMSGEEVEELAIDYINKYIVEAGGVEVVSVEEEGVHYKIVTTYQDQEVLVYASKDGTLLFLATPVNMLEVPEIPQVPESNVVQPIGMTVGNVLVTNEDICKEDGKPIVYFFGSSGCPHCQWEHPVINDVAGKFEGYISYHENMDNNADRDVFARYSAGGVPTMVFGCKYYRQGAGSREGVESETQSLTAVICKLTGGQPANVCSEVQDIIDQI